MTSSAEDRNLLVLKREFYLANLVFLRSQQSFAIRLGSESWAHQQGIDRSSAAKHLDFVNGLLDDCAETIAETEFAIACWIEKNGPFTIGAVAYGIEAVTEFGETYPKLVVRLSKAGEVSAE